MDLEILEGEICGLELNTEVCGPDKRSGLTHKALFKLGNERILLKTSSLSMINNGDKIKVIGLPGAGEFNALVCKNLTTDWQSNKPKLGFAPMVLSLFVLFTATMSILARTFIILTIIVGIILFNLLKVYRLQKRAYKLLES
ncbi:hypothetical protein PQO03_15600 [Lentisphaera profundi]|uniref:Uncharacterized protein n=1 Tax=Lentisphaera profundi TaxID=1658616 RepID=A0ABY7VYE4_9BACT|nr:hypothetical protein [Lentisphaera profundi]WDE99260.1 hypothetical protein PQO03_15600 [Lentisphaera profundi]